MRLHVQDFSGHPFQVELSRELACRGHDVVHTYSTQYVTGHGRLAVMDDDPSTLRIDGITAAREMIKYSPIGRTRFELSYATAWQQALAADAPFDVVIACNVPMLALDRMRRWFARRGQPWVLWHQDLYSLGVGAEASRRLPGPLASAVRRLLERVECAQLTQAAGVVAITDAMVDQYRAWGVERSVTVQPNWAPLSDIAPRDRDNEWARARDLPSHQLRLMYAGTLGRKHNPMLLLDMLDGIKARGVDACLIVASEGEGADQLGEAAGARPDIRFVGFQPTEVFADVLASADAVVALLEPDAARFSVPSKVHSYLSAGRPVVALVPEGNPAAADVHATGGFVGSPTTEGALAAAEWVADATGRPGALAEVGRRARELAEANFDIVRIASRFEEVLAGPGRAVPTNYPVGDQKSSKLQAAAADR